MIRCLIVDDSPTFRLVLREILTADPRIEVVGEAANGQEAIDLAKALKPDVMTLDVHMPGRSGYEVIKEIMTSPQPMPILVISAAADDASDQVTFHALALGAMEVLGKPRAGDPARMARDAETLRTSVRMVAGIKPITRFPAAAAAPADIERSERPPPQCVGIAASTGGPAALEQILKGLPADFPVPVLVVQHIAEGFTAGLVSWLASASALRVKVAEHGELLSAGTVYVAPDNKHLLTSMGRVRLDEGARMRGFRPSATVLFTAMARDYGAAGLGLVLTGMGDDGSIGLKLMKDRGGHVLAQDEKSSVVWGMPKAAVESGAAHSVLPLEQMAAALMRLTSRRAGSRRKPRLLLVDDSETILLLEKTLLKDRFELFLARNGKEAVDASRSVELDAVLMDYSMPVMDGETALRMMRAHPDTSKLPVVIVTGETDPMLWRRCEDAGALCVLKKPVDANEMNKAIARALRAG